MINEYYAHENIKKLIKKKLREENVIELQQFLSLKFSSNVKKKMKKVKFHREENIMSHSYSYSDDKRILGSVFQEIIPYIVDLIPIKNLDLSIVKMAHKDYILVHEDRHKIFIIDLTHDWNDELGGNVVFTNGKGDGTIISSKFNSLVISNGKLRFFIKYINNHSKNKAKYYIIGRFK